MCRALYGAGCVYFDLSITESIKDREFDLKQHYAAELKKDMEFIDFFMVKRSGIRVGANHKQYFDIMLGDKTGEISAKKWDIQPQDVPKLEAMTEGRLVKVKAQVTEWQGALQLRLQRIRLAVDQDGLDISDYVKAAPEDSAAMYDYIYNVADQMMDVDLRALCLSVLKENKDRLMYYPAASRNHHAEYGGLLFHVKRMLMNALGICSVYTDLKKDLLCAGVILHDIEKLDEILSDEHGVSPGYSREGQFLGHLVMGVKYIDERARKLDFPEEKRLMLEQMILSHHYEPEFGSPVRPLFPEGEVLHYLDILDARLFDMYDVLATTEPGHFSERIWTLDNRRIYKPEHDD
jgi:3'-5' exoribonuclease